MGEFRAKNGSNFSRAGTEPFMGKRIIKVCLEVSEEIANGLKDGTYKAAQKPCPYPLIKLLRYWPCVR